MEGECIGVRALQGYYPPKLVFNIRLKNNTGEYWLIFGYGGHVKATDERIDIGTIETGFCRLDMQPDQEYRISAEMELDYKKLDLIEEKRKDDLYLELRMDLLGASFRSNEDLREGMSRGLFVNEVWVKSPGHSAILIPQSEWVKILERLDYGKFKIVELLIPSFPSGVLDNAIESFEKAKVKLSEGDYPEVLIHCQNVLDKIGKAIKPFKSELKERLGEEKFKRLDEFKRALENFLGLRHEVALEKELIIKKDAELALHTTLAFLNYFARRLAELKEK